MAANVRIMFCDLSTTNVLIELNVYKLAFVT